MTAALADRYVALKHEIERCEADMKALKEEILASVPADAKGFELIGENSKIKVTISEQERISWAKAAEKYMTPRQLSDTRRFFCQTNKMMVVRVA